MRLKDCEIGCAVYEKKSEYGPAEMALSGLEMDGVSTPFMVEEGSVLSVEGRSIEPSYMNVAKSLYGP